MSVPLTMVYFCCSEGRRAAVRQSPGLNGIDFLEVVDHDAPSPSQRQRVLRLHLLKPLVRAEPLVPDNVVITGGVRVRGVHADEPVTLQGDLAADDVIVIHVSEPGDFTAYTLRLAEKSGAPLAGFDPLLAAVDFSFKVECPSDFDCREAKPCPAGVPDEPEIDYLSKDFNSFRQLMLDRLSAMVPGWKERNVADLGITLVELLAYVGDYLSYQQDATATEAYLGTARRRVSVRRHARLADYFMSDGCNARVWAYLRVAVNYLKLPRGTQFATRVPGLGNRIAPGSPELVTLLAAAPEIFEAMHDADLYGEHNRIRFYTWGERECCLPERATRAALLGHFPNLHRGDLLLFQEEISPRTGEPEDADRARRHVVRLVAEPVATEDPLYPDPDHPGKHQPVTLIEWGFDDALPFSLCVSAVGDAGRRLDDVSVALGNIVLADHGRTVAGEPLGSSPEADPRLALALPDEHCGSRARTLRRPRFRPRLKNGPLTMAATVSATSPRGERPGFDPTASASDAFRWEMSGVVPEIRVDDDDAGRWLPRRDLLGSDPFASEFVAEVEEDGRATLRFGDDEYGRLPAPGVEMYATYRVGNGTEGNIGAFSLAHIITAESGIESVSNPLPAQGGADPEGNEHVRQMAPAALYTQERAVTADDYAGMAERHRQVQRGAATFRWTGSWRTVFVTVDRIGGAPVDADFDEAVETHLERYRMAGHDMEIDGPRHVPLELEAEICAAPGYFRSDVKSALLEALGNGSFADGRRGFFHPDNFTFAQPVYLSRLYAAAQSVPGVRSVRFTLFRRFGSRGNDTLASGVIEIGRLEIARLDNDRNAPENGIIRLKMGGGR